MASLLLLLTFLLDRHRPLQTIDRFLPRQHVRSNTAAYCALRQVPLPLPPKTFHFAGIPQTHSRIHLVCQKVVSRLYWEQLGSFKAKVLFDPFHAETLRLDHWLHQPTDADLARDPERLRRHRRADLDRLPDDTFVTSCPDSVVLVSTGATAAPGLAALRETDKRLAAAAVRSARFCAPLAARASFPHAVAAPPRHAENGACARERLWAPQDCHPHANVTTLKCSTLFDQLTGTAHACVSTCAGQDDALVTSSTGTPFFSDTDVARNSLKIGQVAGVT